MPRGMRILKEVAPNVYFWLDVDVYYDLKDIVVTDVEPRDPDGWIKLAMELDLSKIVMVHGFTMMDYFQNLVSWEDVEE